MIKCISYIDYCHSFYGAFYSFLYECTLNIDITLNYASLMGSDARILNFRCVKYCFKELNLLKYKPNQTHFWGLSNNLSLTTPDPSPLIAKKRAAEVYGYKQVKLEEKAIAFNKAIVWQIYIYIFM